MQDDVTGFEGTGGGGGGVWSASLSLSGESSTDRGRASKTKVVYVTKGSRDHFGTLRGAKNVEFQEVRLGLRRAAPGVGPGRVRGRGYVWVGTGGYLRGLLGVARVLPGCC